MTSEHGYEAVIGLEVHVQLQTRSKMFCRCANRFGAEPNTLVCPLCLGYPGALPVPNRHAVDLAVELALAIGCTVHPISVFARKNYFYPDLPKGYQITQHDRPLAETGLLPLTNHEKSVRIERLHIEEDAGKLLHEAPGGGELDGISLVDFNRCGVPLVEIVSRPDMATADEAQDYLQTLYQVLLYTETSDGNMEEGSLRCDANVSVRRKGETELGTKTEVKNVNSFRNVGRAIEHEIERQIGMLESGREIRQETRSFDAGAGVTRPMRGKEDAHDYRYFPEPDLPPLILERERIRAIESSMPELPWQKRARFVAAYGLPAGDVHLLASSRELADYYESAVAELPSQPKPIANWVMTEVLRELKERKATIAEAAAALPPARLAALVALVDAGSLSSSAGKAVFAAIWGSGEEPAAAVGRLGLAQVSDQGEVMGWIEAILTEHAAPVAQYRAGRTATFAYLVGQVMKRSGGRAEPKLVQRLLRAALEAEPGTDTAP
jgi:aspartyl-tRNA(Asn)/glutamyl-tRNA(Gln) amidotransferase subunit B